MLGADKEVDPWPSTRFPRGSRAADAGASVLSVVADQFYGDRSGRIADPAGHVWIVSTHKEDVSAALECGAAGQRSKVKSQG